MDAMRQLLDASVGNRGAVANCRRELRRTRDAERAVDELSRRLPARTPERTPTSA